MLRKSKLIDDTLAKSLNSNLSIFDSQIKLTKETKKEKEPNESLLNLVDSDIQFYQNESVFEVSSPWLFLSI